VSRRFKGRNRRLTPLGSPFLAEIGHSAAEYQLPRRASKRTLARRRSFRAGRNW
jgi:hypothetical protein